MRTPIECLVERARIAPEETPIGVHGQVPATYGQWLGMVASVSAQLIHRAGFKPGQRVLQVVDSSQWIKFAVLYVSVTSCGGSIATLTSDDPFVSVADAISKMHIDHVIVPSVHAEDGYRQLKHQRELEFRVTAKPDLLSRLVRNRHPEEEGEILFTSGTTGPRKAIVCPWGDICSSLGRSAENPSDHFPDQSVLVHHAVPGGQAAQRILLQLLRSGRLSSVSVPDQVGASLLDAAQTNEARFLGLVPATGQRLVEACRHSNVALTSVEWISLGSEAVPQRLMSDLAEVCPNAQVMNMYGCTEAGFARIHGCHALPPLCIGRPEPTCQVRILDDVRREVATGEIGWLWVGSTDGYPRRYLFDSDLNDRTFRDGWVNTGDMGWVDASGQVFLAGRHLDTIEIDGETVYPFQIEEAIRTLDFVTEVCVLASDDGALCVAVATCNEAGDAEVLLEAVHDFCEENLGKTQRPETYLMLSQIPVGQFGTVQKRVIEAMLREDRDERKTIRRFGLASEPTSV